MVLAMHAGFAFLELGTVRAKNQVNALVKILCDFSISTIAYFFVGYAVAYGIGFFSGADILAEKNGYELIHLQGNLLLKKKKLIGNKLQSIKYFLNEE